MMDTATRQRLRALVDQRRRELLGVTPCPLGWGSTTGYRKGCRCHFCTDAANQIRQTRRKRNPEATKAYNREYWHRRKERDASRAKVAA